MMNNNQDSPIAYNHSAIEFEGNTLHSDLANPHNGTWLLGSGASCYITMHKSLFMKLYPWKSKPLVYLPYGTNCSPKFYGFVYISPHIILDNVYFIPEFKVNLILVTYLVKSSNLSFTFLLKNAFCRTWILIGCLGNPYNKGTSIISQVLLWPYICLLFLLKPDIKGFGMPQMKSFHILH